MISPGSIIVISLSFPGPIIIIISWPSSVISVSSSWSVILLIFLPSLISPIISIFSVIPSSSSLIFSIFPVISSSFSLISFLILFLPSFSFSFAVSSVHSFGELERILDVFSFQGLVETNTIFVLLRGGFGQGNPEE